MTLLQPNNLKTLWSPVFQVIGLQEGPETQALCVTLGSMRGRATLAGGVACIPQCRLTLH